MSFPTVIARLLVVRIHLLSPSLSSTPLQSLPPQEMERELRLASQEVRVLNEQLDAALDRQEEMEDELARLNDLQSRSNRRPSALATVTGRNLSLAHAPLSSVFDAQWACRLMARIPFFAMLSTPLLHEMLSRAKHLLLEPGTSLSASNRECGRAP